MKTNNFVFIRYLNKNEVIKFHLIVFQQLDYDGSQGHSSDRAADKVSVTTESYCYE